MSLFTGSAVALVTPFKGGQVDYTALTRLIELQIVSGTDAIVTVATTGEAPTLSVDERLGVIQFVHEQVNGRIPVIAGTGGNCTEEVIELSRSAEAIGVDGLLVVTPYYNKTSQRGLVEHYCEVASSVDIPVLIYNVPSRTGLNILPDTVAEITSKVSNVIGIKEASDNIEQIVMLSALCPDLDIYSGSDGYALPVLSVGGKGVISTIANVVPDSMHAMCEAYFKGDTALAKEIQIQMMPLYKAAFADVNPIPIKEMLAQMKLCNADVRLPLVKCDKALQERIRQTLTAYGLI